MTIKQATLQAWRTSAGQIKDNSHTTNTKPMITETNIEQHHKDKTEEGPAEKQERTWAELYRIQDNSLNKH
jgi:hypothetical protein